MQQALYGLIGFILLLIVIVLIACKIIHYRHKLKMLDLAKKERMINQGPDELHVAQLGDSTLNVTLFIFVYEFILNIFGSFLNSSMSI